MRDPAVGWLSGRRGPDRLASSLAWALLFAALAGCASPAPTAEVDQAADPPAAARAQDAPPLSPTGPASEAADQAASPAAPTQAVSGSTAIRQELAATDPTGVVLGGGRPALVEFFAFW